MVGAVVGAVALVMLAFVVMVLAVMVMFAVVLASVVAGRVIGAVLGKGGAGAADGKRQGNGERCGYARYELHLCLLTNEFRS